jgi:hypothetical protein
MGDAWGGLLNASFGNAVELLIAILALVKGQIDIVQASMVGSILSNSEWDSRLQCPFLTKDSLARSGHELFRR